MERKNAFPRKVDASDVKALRSKLNMTQKEFAQTLGVSKPTAERWERAENRIGGLEAVLFDMFMIIEKTQGRMEEDDFWLDIVR